MSTLSAYGKTEAMGMCKGVCEGRQILSARHVETQGLGDGGKVVNLSCAQSVQTTPAGGCASCGTARL